MTRSTRDDPVDPGSTCSAQSRRMRRVSRVKPAPLSAIALNRSMRADPRADPRAGSESHGLETEQLLERGLEPAVAGVDDGEGQADPGRGRLGEGPELVVGLLGQPDHAGVVTEVVLPQLGMPVEAELAD